MNVLELSEKIEAEGYELKSIRRFKNSFHINYWSPNAKMQLFIKVPLNSVQWRDLKPHFPKVLEVSNKQ